ncbi:MAG: MBL fold metallo-hydrolase [Candidatus Goldbacteria bacterium]|nr:MBL fold metallo-hydrolase [Candidatus Goldiibacteriota bacterium]
MLKLKFSGAAREVTGSFHIIEKDGKNFAIDCGMIQGKRKESYERNRQFPLPPSDVQAMILTHAHIDHSGNIPTFTSQGFKGDIYSTYATKDLCSIMLPDSAFVQLKDLEYVNRKRIKQGKAPFEPLYTEAQAEAALKQFVPKNLGENFPLTDGLYAYLLNAGHILGSSMAVVKLKEGNKKIKICFSGDLGRKSLPILKDPDEIYDVDYLILESTYGGRDHKAIDTAQDRLSMIITETYKKNGRVIIPVFAVERTQEMLYVLNQLAIANKIPAMPIFVDSPLAIEATEVFKKHSECFDEKMMDYIANNNNPFYLELVRYTRDVDESMAINEYRKPCIVLSAQGMCEAGRILHHLKNGVDNPNNTILFVGYQAANTLGRKIVEGERNIKIFGEPHTVQARVEKIDEFSGHAGQSDLVEFVKKASGPKLKKVLLVHGEEEEQRELMKALKDAGIENVYNPEPGYVEVIDP